MPVGDYWPGMTWAGTCPHGIPFGQRCYPCEPVMPAAASGWECPRCRVICSPQIFTCPACVPAPRLAAPETSLPPPGADALPGPFAMTPGDEYRFTVIGDWAEVLPDLQCRLDRAIYTCGSAEPAAVDLVFRRAPQGVVSADAGGA